jgi:putative ABC transport system permease protein
MSLLDALRHRLRPLLHRRAFDREMDEEFRHHLDLGAQEFPEGGDPAAAAAARARFGSRAYYMEETRRMTPLGWLDALRQDLRYALRNLRRAPAFTAVAVLSLAIGIGANSAIFSLIYSILLNPLAVPRPEQLVQVQRTGSERANDDFSHDQFRFLRQTSGFAGIAAFGGVGSVAIAAGNVRNVVDVDAVDGSYFSLLGVQPLVGRLIGARDERTHAPVVVISDALWAQLFSRAPSAIGRTVTLGSNAFTVVGVVPESYQGLHIPGSFDAAVPLADLALIGGPAVLSGNSTSPALQIVARLRHPGDLARESTMLDAAYRACCAPAHASGVTLVSIEHGITSPKFDVRAMYSRLLFELMGSAVIVLLAACANIGTLLLARASARQRELAVRRSLGASRARLAAQMMVESTILAVLGGAGALLVANWGLHVVAHRLPDLIVHRAGFRFNGRILGFTAVVAIVSVLLFGVVPAWRATRTHPIASLKEGGTSGAGRAGWLDRSVVVAQLALALVLVNGAGLLVATLRNLRNPGGGFATERTVTTELDARRTSYERAGLIPLSDRLLTRARRIPGVRSAALSLAVPVYGGRRVEAAFGVEGYTPGPDETMNVWVDPVTPGYFSTLGIALRAGRDFSATDRPAAQPVAIVNQAFVHQYVRDRDPLGTTVRAVEGADTVVLQIVGVAADARYGDLRAPPPPMMYVPLAQFAPMVPGGAPGFHGGLFAVLEVSVRTSGDDRAMPSALRSAMLAEAPEVHLDGPETIEDSLDSALQRETLTAELATLFGAVALILAAIGLYGVVSYRVAQRTREIGVRMALGAARSAVVWMVLRQALVLVALGMLVGAPLAFGGGRVIGALLYGLGGENPVFVLGAGVLLVGVAVAASAFPARRAARVDPLVALRAE